MRDLSERSHAEHRALKPALSVAFAMALSGTVGIFATETGEPAHTIVFFRCFFGFLVLSIWCLWNRKFESLSQLNGSDLVLIVVSGVFLTLNWASLFESFEHISVGFSFVIYHLQPFWIVLFSALFLSEPLTRRKTTWLLLAFLGLVLVLWPNLGDISASIEWQKGVGFSLLASVLYAGTTLTSRKAVVVDPAVLATFHCVIGMVVFFPFLSLSDVVNLSIEAWLLLMSLGVIHTGFIYVLLYTNYPKVEPSVIGVCAFLNPITALIADFVVYGTTISAIQTVGVAGVLLGGLGMTLARSAQERAKS